MDIKIIAFGMVAIMAALFIYVRFYRPKEKRRMGLEAKYAELIYSYRSNQLPEVKKQVESVGQEYGESLGMKEDNIKEMISKDLKI